jgi:hypothetical protein
MVEASCFRIACIAFHLRGSVRNLGFQRFFSGHRKFQVGTIDREGQVGLARKESLDVRERGILQFDDELLAVVRRDQVDCEPHPFRLAAVHADAQEVEEQFARPVRARGKAAAISGETVVAQSP